MSTKIAFFGIESYDIIHYFSRILKNLSHSVLVIDESRESEIAVSIPIPKCDELELCVCSFNYRGIDFTKYWKTEKIEKYDYILTYFGKNINEALIQEHDYLYYITDLQLQNIKNIQKARRKLLDYTHIEQYLVIRDFLGVKKKRYIEYECNFNESYYLLEDITDKKLMHECQYNSIFTFRKASPDLKGLLIDMYERNGEINRKFRKAFRRAERGR